jgi:cell wall-associated NlpC family hydrolase
MEEIDRERARVAALAREWIGTPYRHNARLKGIGCDCTFFAMVYAEVGLIEPPDIAHYHPQFHLHRGEERYLDAVLEHATEIEAPGLGDLVLYKVGRVFSHAAIIVDPGWPIVVHAFAATRCVIEAHGDAGMLAGYPRKFFTLWT